MSLTIDETPNFYLSRGEISTLVYALEQYSGVMRKEAHGRSNAPGQRAGAAMASAEADMLRQRLTRYAIDQGWMKLKPEAVKRIYNVEAKEK